VVAGSHAETLCAVGEKRARNDRRATGRMRSRALNCVYLARQRYTPHRAHRPREGSRAATPVPQRRLIALSYGRGPRCDVSSGQIDSSPVSPAVHRIATVPGTRGMGCHIPATPIQQGESRTRGYRLSKRQRAAPLFPQFVADGPHFCPGDAAVLAEDQQPFSRSTARMRSMFSTSKALNGIAAPSVMKQPSLEKTAWARAV
jgi:hypothetical protein